MSIFGWILIRITVIYITPYSILVHSMSHIPLAWKDVKVESTPCDDIKLDGEKRKRKRNNNAKSSNTVTANVMTQKHHKTNLLWTWFSSLLWLTNKKLWRNAQTPTPWIFLATYYSKIVLIITSPFCSWNLKRLTKCYEVWRQIWSKSWQKAVTVLRWKVSCHTTRHTQIISRRFLSHTKTVSCASV